MAERNDEFDVACGDVFVILSKFKGWWVVYRDLGPSPSDHERAELKSGWIPAGCLLETSVPPLGNAPIEPHERTAAPINPLAIVSISTPGIALMDYDPHGKDELRIRTGDALRIYKRYNSWSYAIREDTADRGWAPSWLIGKGPKDKDRLAAADSRSPVPPKDSPLKGTPLSLDDRILPSPRDASPQHHEL